MTNSRYPSPTFALYADPINSPSHYEGTTGIECIDAIKACMPLEAYSGFLAGNVVKYVWRYRRKGGLESLQKANWYLNQLINELKSQEPT